MLSNPARSKSLLPLWAIENFIKHGNELEICQAFVDKAQAWYRTKLLADLDEAKKREFTALEKTTDRGRNKRPNAPGAAEPSAPMAAVQLDEA